jgi:hypothetical protein
MGPASHYSVHISPSLHSILCNFNLTPATFFWGFFILSRMPVFFSLCCVQTPPFRKFTFRYFYVPTRSHLCYADVHSIPREYTHSPTSWIPDVSCFPIKLLLMWVPVLVSAAYITMFIYLRATCSAHVTILDLMIRISCEENKLWSSSLTHSLTHGAELFLRSCQLCSHSRTS